MLQIVVAGIAVLAVALLFLFGARSATAQPAEGKTPRPPVTAPAPPPPGAGRHELRERLRTLAETPPPSKLAMGAMCYEPMAVPGRAEYVCPKCAKRTLYAVSEGHDDPDARPADSSTVWLLEEVAEARQRAKEIRGIDLRLDESEFCKACSPAAKEPRLSIVVHHPGAAAPHRFRGVNADDLRLIGEFMAGKTVHRLGNDAERPMKDYLMRLQKLLGVPMLELQKPQAPAKQ